MAAADCATCEMLGYRSCDTCGNVAFPQNVEDSPAGLEFCGYCLSSAKG